MDEEEGRIRVFEWLPGKVSHRTLLQPLARNPGLKRSFWNILLSFVVFESMSQPVGGRQPNLRHAYGVYVESGAT